jgi:hypothetical protein
MSELEIFSSTGQLGTDVRQDDRLYHNAEFFSANYDHVENQFNKLQVEADARPEPISRVVYRGVVSTEVLETIQTGELRQNLEVALPLIEFSARFSALRTSPRLGWLIYLGHNATDRAATPLREAASDPHSQPAPSAYSPVERVERMFQRGQLIRTTIEASDVEPLQELWQPTFGWSLQEIEALRNRLEHERQGPEHERSVWFAATYSGGLLVSAAMAERLIIPGPDGPINLVESTEWCTLRDNDNPQRYTGQGLITGALVAVNTQVLHSLRDNVNGPPLIYAECNATSQSHRAGYGAGFRIPTRDYAPQFIPKNVTVNDGIAPTGLRDFNFLYLKRSIQAQHYNQRATDRILQIIERGQL